LYNSTTRAAADQKISYAKTLEPLAWGFFSNLAWQTTLAIRCSMRRMVEDAPGILAHLRPLGAKVCNSCNAFLDPPAGHGLAEEF
jgi:hypothetical protein